MGKRRERVHRPLRKGEYEIRFGTSNAEKAWRDLLATQRNALVTAWEHLTTGPLERSGINYPLKDDLGTVTRDGASYEQRQYKCSGGARLWFYVDEWVVVLTQVHTRHPNETK